MPHLPTEYQLPFETLSGADLAARLPEGWTLIPGAAIRVSLTLLDTFDWALHGAGGWLLWCLSGERAWLSWRRLDDRGAVLDQPLDAPPAFAQSLPSGPLRERILTPGAGRRLLPLLRLERFQRTLLLRNAQGEPLGELELSEFRWNEPESVAALSLAPAVASRGGVLAPRLRLAALRGQRIALHEVAPALVAALCLEPARVSVYEEALAQLGRRPGDYSSKFALELSPEMPAEAATRAILRTLCRTLEANVAGASAHLDPEFLHDLRVATRRTRSALSQIKGVFPEPLVEDFRERFAWLQQISGPARDLDVYLGEFAAYRDSLPESLRPRLDPVRLYLERLQAEEQRHLATLLAGERFAMLLSDWRAFLAAPAQHAAHACEPIKPLADARIWRLVRRVRREGRAIGPDTPQEALHELRKSCKKLRYLMEFFASLYPERAVRRQIKLIKVLLDHLGALQDLSVQTAWLRALARRMSEEGEAEAETLLAMGALIARLLERQQQLRKGFGPVFDGWLDAGTQRRLRELFAPDAS